MTQIDLAPIVDNLHSETVRRSVSEERSEKAGMCGGDSVRQEGEDPCRALTVMRSSLYRIGYEMGKQCFRTF